MAIVGNISEMDALDLLTEDCWKEILKRVEDPKDLRSCSEACLIFQEILAKKRNAFMFDSILLNILEYLKRKRSEDEDLLEPEPEPWKVLLKCRLVCKDWCKSMDKLDNADYGYIFHRVYSFFSGGYVERFLQKFANHDGNPFLGRCVRLHHTSALLLAGEQAEGLNSNPAQAFYVRKLYQLVERFGKEIWTLEMIESSLNQHLEYCKNLQTVLSHSPNLRSLEALRDGFNVNIVQNELDQQREMAELTTYIEANSLPSLPLLESLKGTGVNAVMIRAILEKSSQVKTLILGDPSGFPEPCLQLCNLEKLELLRLDASTSLHGLRQLRSPLRSLRLRVITNRENVDVWAIDELFRNIQHLPIQYLYIVTRNVFWGESGPIPADERSSNGAVSLLHLDFSSGSVSFNILLYCPKLTFVSMSYCSQRQGIPPGHPNGVPELLDVSDLLEQDNSDFYKSNIWDNLQHLEVLRLCDGTSMKWKWSQYERVEFEKRRLENGKEAADALL